MDADEATAWWRACKLKAFAHKSEAKEAQAATKMAIGVEISADTAAFQEREEFKDGRSLGIYAVEDLDPSEMLRVLFYYLILLYIHIYYFKIFLNSNR